MSVRVHVVGAGPVGLLLTALLQSTEGCSVHLSEKRKEYTRTRMVQLAPYLVADSVESYRTDAIDGDSVEAIFDPAELEEGLAYRRSIAPDLATLLRGWALGFCPLNSIESSLSDLIDSRGHGVERTAAPNRRWLQAGNERPSLCPLTDLPRRRLGDRIAVLPVDLARLRERNVPRAARRA